MQLATAVTQILSRRHRRSFCITKRFACACEALWSRKKILLCQIDLLNGPFIILFWETFSISLAQQFPALSTQLDMYTHIFVT